MDDLVQVKVDRESVIGQAGSNELRAPSHDISKDSALTVVRLPRTPTRSGMADDASWFCSLTGRAFEQIGRLSRFVLIFHREHVSYVSTQVRGHLRLPAVGKLDEARHTADPVHLVRVFGITESTAINYVYAAHPGRQSVIPR